MVKYDNSKKAFTNTDLFSLGSASSPTSPTGFSVLCKFSGLNLIVLRATIAYTSNGNIDIMDGTLYVPQEYQTSLDIKFFNSLDSVNKRTLVKQSGNTPVTYNFLTSHPTSTTLTLTRGYLNVGSYDDYLLTFTTPICPTAGYMRFDFSTAVQAAYTPLGDACESR
jgi:hypothetical protein